VFYLGYGGLKQIDLSDDQVVAAIAKNDWENQMEPVEVRWHYLLAWLGVEGALRNSALMHARKQASHLSRGCCTSTCCCNRRAAVLHTTSTHADRDADRICAVKHAAMPQL
jgi:hypothetical protein